MVDIKRQCNSPHQQQQQQLQQSSDVVQQTFKQEMASTISTCTHQTHIKSKARSKMLKEYEEKMGKTGKKRPLSRIPLWYFLHEILEVEQCKGLIQWEDENNLVFTIKSPKELAALWGQIKDKETMTYPKLARGIRYYYGKGVIEKFNGKRFSYKFVVSRKTKAVLSKRKNIPEEVDVTLTKKTSMKRKETSNHNKKYTTTPASVSNRRRESSNTDTSTDSNDILSNGNSDWDDEDDSFSESDWNNLDACINEFFSESSIVNSMFESLSDEKSDLIPSTTSPTTTTTTSDNTMFIMNSSPPELTEMLPTVNNSSSTSAFSTIPNDIPAIKVEGLPDYHSNLISTSGSNYFEASYGQIINNSSRYSYDDFIAYNISTTSSTTATPYSPYELQNNKQKLNRKRSRSMESERLVPYNKDDSPYSFYSEESRNQSLYSSLPDFSTIYSEESTDECSQNYFTNILMSDDTNSSSYMIPDISIDAEILESLL